MTQALPTLERTSHLTVELTRDGAQRTRAQAVPGCYWDRARGAWVTDDPEPRTAAIIMALFPDALVDHPELADIRARDYGEARPHNYADGLGISLDVGPLGPITLHDWQDTDLGYLRAIGERDGGINLQWDRGLGKTVATAAFIQATGAMRSLVVCRNDAKDAVWRDQLSSLLPNHRLMVLPGSDRATKRDRLLGYMGSPEALDPDQPLVFVIHYEALAWVAGEKGRGKGWSKLGQWDIMAFDEGHRLASYNPNSKRNTQMGRALSKLRKNHVDLAVNLTGSGIMNHGEDLFGQLHFLFPSVYKAKWRDWNDRFLDYVDDGHRKVCIGFRADTLPRLRQELGVFTVYRRKDEVLDLPPLIQQDIHLDLHPAQRRAYDEMRDQFWTTIEERGLLALNAMDQMTKLRRIATYVPNLASVKLDFTVGELDEAHDEQFVVFTWFKAPGHALAERYGDDVVVVDGDVAPRHRPELLRRHAAGQARVLVGSIATLGESLNFQYCHEAIRLDRDWNPQVNGQTIDRLRRQGQETRVTIRDLWAKDTVDTLRVYPNNLSKDSLRKALYG